MTRQSHRSKGFTLLELLIVIGIIAILMATTVIVGVKIVSSGKQRVTEGVLKALDTSLSQYVHAQGRLPPPYVVDPRDSKYVQPVADAAIGDAVPPPQDQMHINTVGLYMLQCQADPDAAKTIKELDPKLVRLYDPDSVGTTFGLDKRPALYTVLDGWGQPIRYVHPAFQGVIGDFGNAVDPATKAPPPPGKLSGVTKIRRTSALDASGSPPANAVPDADGGVPLTNRPYFYSVGPDLLTGYKIQPSTTDPSGYDTLQDWNKDNVYAGQNPKYSFK